MLGHALHHEKAMPQRPCLDHDAARQKPMFHRSGRAPADQSIPMSQMRPSISGVMQVLCLLCCFFLVAGCALPPVSHRTVSTALDEAESRATRLGASLVPRTSAHPGKSGLYLLQDTQDAFAARVMLAQTAQRTLDVQYYIWRDDLSGTLLLEALHAAADRGVRVRLLLDDNGVAGLDRELAALDAHPNIEVRLFNPFVVRNPKWLGYLTDFSRANRRMHNKSFTADNQATLLGGRNVGDEYFGAAEGMLFADLDVFAVGPVVSAVSGDFDRYWTSGSSYPVSQILPRVDPDGLAQLAAKASQVTRDPKAAAYREAIRRTDFIRALMDGKLDFEWAETRMVSDDPRKGLGKAKAQGLLTYQLEAIIGAPEQDVALVSSYFVPTAAGVDAFVEMAARGVTVRILTNSLDATDVAVVHAGYVKWRKDLLEAGIALYEMRRLSPETRHDKPKAPFSSGASSLHAKTFAVDGGRVFIGSFNFDPRSANLNTESGLVIDSPRFARQIADAFDEAIPAYAYEVRLDKDGQLYWLERRGSIQIRHDTEPGTGFLKRSGVFLLSLLPIEWLL